VVNPLAARQGRNRTRSTNSIIAVCNISVYTLYVCQRIHHVYVFIFLFFSPTSQKCFPIFCLPRTQILLYILCIHIYRRRKPVVGPHRRGGGLENRECVSIVSIRIRVLATDFRCVYFIFVRVYNVYLFIFFHARVVYVRQHLYYVKCTSLVKPVVSNVLNTCVRASVFER
jgi:hypothetical protein